MQSSVYIEEQVPEWQPLRRLGKTVRTQGMRATSQLPVQVKEESGEEVRRAMMGGGQAEEGREEEAIFLVKALLKAVEESGGHMTPKALSGLESSG